MITGRLPVIKNYCVSVAGRINLSAWVYGPLKYSTTLTTIILNKAKMSITMIVSKKLVCKNTIRLVK